MTISEGVPSNDIAHEPSHERSSTCLLACIRLLKLSSCSKFCSNACSHQPCIMVKLIKCARPWCLTAVVAVTYDLGSIKDCLAALSCTSPCLRCSINISETPTETETFRTDHQPAAAVQHMSCNSAASVMSQCGRMSWSNLSLAVATTLCQDLGELLCSNRAYRLSTALRLQLPQNLEGFCKLVQQSGLLDCSAGITPDRSTV